MASRVRMLWSWVPSAVDRCHVRPAPIVGAKKRGGRRRENAPPLQEKTRKADCQGYDNCSKYENLPLSLFVFWRPRPRAAHARARGPAAIGGTALTSLLPA